MKLGKKKFIKVFGETKLEKNKGRKDIKVLLVVVVTVGLMAWVYSVGKKAEQTVKVVMLDQNVYKNQVITEDMIKPYDMLRGEFEKFAITDENGKKVRRIVLWEERNKILNTFAAYPLQKDTYAEYRSFIGEKTSNSDKVLYSFPGKEIVPLEVTGNDLDAFKTYLQPGDRLNVEAVFSEKATIIESDGFGGVIRNQLDIFKTETVFKDIVVADLLNDTGDSILDIYESFKNMSAYDQEQIESSEAFKKATKPKTLLLALTPQEKERYYYYLSKNDVKFKVSLPQRNK
ncbi:MAG: hypothetical protein QXD03_03940 [Candidatus Anstonellales archaeon]